MSKEVFDRIASSALSNTNKSKKKKNITNKVSTSDANKVPTSDAQEEKLTDDQKHNLAIAVSGFPCIWKVDHPHFMRQDASKIAFKEIAKQINVKAESCRQGWQSLKNALKYQQNIKPKRKKLKSGEPNTFDDSEESTQIDDATAMEAWEFYDSMKFFAEQQSSKKRKTVDSFESSQNADLNIEEVEEHVDKTPRVINKTSANDGQSDAMTAEEESPGSVPEESAGPSNTPPSALLYNNRGTPKTGRKNNPIAARNNYESSNYSYAWLQDKKEEKERDKGLMNSLTELININIRKNQEVESKTGPDQTALKYHYMFVNLDRMLQKLPETTVERLNLKFQQLIFDEIDLNID